MRRTETPMKSFRGWGMSVGLIIAFILLLGTNLTGLYVRTAIPITNAAGYQPREIRLRAAGRGAPLLSLQDGHELQVSYVGSSLARAEIENGSAQPLTLEACDFDADGAPDVVAGYATGRKVLVVLHKGTMEAYGPSDPETIRKIAQGSFPSPFVESAVVIEVPESPDFLTTGDFDRDGRPDV